MSSAGYSPAPSIIPEAGLTHYEALLNAQRAYPDHGRRSRLDDLGEEDRLRSGAGAPEPDRAKHGLLLIPWSIGNRLDITLHAVRCVRRLRCFLAEDPDLSREQFAALLGAGVRAKRFWRLPDRPDPKFLKMVLGLLKSEDVGLVSGGGIPCFVDPGAWVVRELRRAGVSVTALAGASSLASVLCLSGIEWRSSNPVFSFAFFPAGSSSDPARGDPGRRQPS